MTKIIKCISIEQQLVERVAQLAAGGSFSATLERLVRQGLDKEKQIDDIVAARLSGVVSSLIVAVR